MFLNQRTQRAHYARIPLQLPPEQSYDMGPSLISLICFSWIYFFSVLAGNVIQSVFLEKRFLRKTVRYKRSTRDSDNDISLN
jgi:hypothetical protein